MKDVSEDHKIYQKKAMEAEEWVYYSRNEKWIFAGTP